MHIASIGIDLGKTNTGHVLGCAGYGPDRRRRGAIRNSRVRSAEGIEHSTYRLRVVAPQQVHQRRSPSEINHLPTT
jgi:hypothetical protein